MTGKTRRPAGYYLVQAITLVRIPIVIGFAVALLTTTRETRSLTLCVALLILAELTDFFDGFVARKGGFRSEFGAMLDPYSDSISRIIVFWALACDSLVWAVVPLSLAFRDVTVAYARVQLTKVGASVGALMSGKIKALVQGIGAMWIVVTPSWVPGHSQLILDVFSAVVLVSTLASTVEYVYAAMKASASTE